ncbi:MAG: X-Pro dipeptidyl-peptidase, partial [Planctomycetes bacterium]|nr:X-Pro dipeptidyl-peptidase [Planctomycetota bacterium]
MNALMFLLLLNCAGQTSAPPMDEAKQLRDHVKANYTKYEYQIPMRDGIKIFTSVYVPKDDSKTYPIMLNRTP